MCSNRNIGYSAAVFSLASFALLAGCTSSGGDQAGHATNVQGRMLHTPETFTGESTASIDGEGSISLVSDHGARCTGPYRQVPDGNAGEVRSEGSNNGIATLTCNDGRTGKVMFTVGPRQAIGTGMLGQDILTLTIEE